MIYYMNTKTLIKEFGTINDPEVVLKSNYVILSSRIRKSKEHKYVINATEILGFFNIGMRINKDLSDDFNISLFKEFFDKNHEGKLFLIKLIQASINDGENVILVSSPNEMDIGYFNYLSKYIYQEFLYPIIDYARIKYEDREFSPSYTLKLLKKESKRIIFSNPDSKKAFLHKKMKKKEMIKILKKKNLYHSSMDKDDMIDMLETFWL